MYPILLNDIDDVVTTRREDIREDDESGPVHHLLSVLEDLLFHTSATSWTLRALVFYCPSEWLYIYSAYAPVRRHNSTQALTYKKKQEERKEKSMVERIFEASICNAN